MKTINQFFKTTSAFILLFMCSLSFSQQGINYQGVARDANSELLTNVEITLDINIVETEVEGIIVYSETNNVMTDINGVFSIVIGNGTPTLNLFEDINWAEDQHFLNVWMDGVEIGTTEFVSVPYASAMGKWQAHKNGVTTKRTGGSIFIGDNAGENDDLTGNNNIGLGLNALKAASTGYINVAIGYEPLMINRAGYFNIGIGSRPLYNNITGHNNIALGNQSLFYNSTGSLNIALGQQSLNSNISGSNNIALGHLSLSSNTLGDLNVASGYRALSKNTIGENNIALGNSPLYNNIDGNYNIALGFESLYYNTTGGNNVAMGYRTLYSNTSGIFNVALGSAALRDNTTGSSNMASGFLALGNNTSGSNNIALGTNAMHDNISGDTNIALGPFTLYSNTTGSNNIAFGQDALNSNTTGGNNIASGFHALNANTIGYSNIAIGSNSLQSNTSATRNIAIGEGTLSANITGSSNVAIGVGAGIQSLGSGNIFMGRNAGWSETGSNKLYIENSLSSTPLIYGDFNTDVLGFNAKVGIGTQMPAVPLQITSGIDATLGNGTGQILLGLEHAANLVLDNNEIQARNNGVATTLYLQAAGGNVNVGGAVVHASDRRLKRDIVDISYGLKAVMQLEPKEYFWKGKTQEYKSLGLIAQEVDEVIKNVVTYDKEIDRYGVSYTELIPVLIKAIQEQQKVIETQNKHSETQSEEISSLESRLQVLETKLLQLN